MHIMQNTHNKHNMRNKHKLFLKYAHVARILEGTTALTFSGFEQLAEPDTHHQVTSGAT